MINRSKNALISASKNPPKKASRENACFFWLLMLYYEHSRLNGRGCPSGIETSTSVLRITILRG